MLSSRRRRLAGNEEEEAFDDAFLSALGEDEDPMGMGMGMDMMGGGGGGGSGVDFLSAFGMLGGGFGEDESEAEGGFGDDMDLEAFMENFDQCGIDVEELTGKALGAYLLYGGAFSNFDDLLAQMELTCTNGRRLQASYGHGNRYGNRIARGPRRPS